MKITRYIVNGGSVMLREDESYEHGQCLWVRDSDYNKLQTQLTALTSQLESVVAELSAVDKIHNDAVFITDEHYAQCPPEVQKMLVALAVLQIPAYKAFLAEVRASGVDAAIEVAKNLVAQEFQYKDFDTAQRVCSKFPESDLVGKVEMVEWLADFAAQLRQVGEV